MTKNEFIKIVDGAPYDFEKVAEIGQNCVDWDVQKVCKDYLDALADLEQFLDEIGVELG